MLRIVMWTVRCRMMSMWMMRMWMMRIEGWLCCFHGIRIVLLSEFSYNPNKGVISGHKTLIRSTYQHKAAL